MAKKKLKDHEIERALTIPSGSEDGEDFSDADSDDDMKKIRQAIHSIDDNLEDSEEEVDVTTVQDKTVFEESISVSNSADIRISPSTSSASGHCSSSKGKSTQVSDRRLSSRGKSRQVSVRPSSSKGKSPRVLGRPSTSRRESPQISDQPSSSRGKSPQVTGRGSSIRGQENIQSRQVSKSSSASSRSSFVAPFTRRQAQTVPTKKRRFIWKKNISLNCPSSEFRGNTNLDVPFTLLESPMEYFLYFFSDDLLAHIAEETQRYSIQVDSSKPFQVSILELKKFFGILMIMALAPLPNTRQYWNAELGIPLIIETMTLNHFEKIRRFLHFNDNSTQPPSGNPGFDRLHKIRPLLETLRKMCQSVPKRESLSVDEQMCSTKACNFLRQYLPNKPHKWGYKLLVLCDDEGFAYDFEIYSGTENDPNLRPENEPDLGASSNIVVRLARCIPRNENYKLFFDNYYTSPELLAYLAKEGILSLGTVNKCRLGKNINIPTLQELKAQKKQRGYSEQWVANVDGVDLATVMWYDNKPVVLASSFTEKEPTTIVKRFCKKTKKRLDVECPNIVKHYNRHMGGVDLLDSFIGKHKLKMRTRKWYIRLFYHLLDVTVINSWLLYKRMEHSKNNPKTLKLREFKLMIAKSLCKCGPSLQKKRGRPTSASDDMIENKRKKACTSVLPPRDVRRDGIEHFPKWLLKRQRCKLPGCKGKTFIFCEKCRVELCLNKYKNCFREFHQ